MNLAQPFQYPSDYVIYVILPLMVIVFGLLIGVGVWFYLSGKERDE